MSASPPASGTLTLLERYRRVALPLVAVAPRTPGLSTLVRGSTTMYGDAAAEKFAAAVALWTDGALAWETEVRDLDYVHPAEIRVPDARAAGEPGLLEVFITREAYVDGVERPRVPGYEESWVFLVGGPAPGDTAVSVPSVPYIGSRKKGIDHKYQCFAGLRLARAWRSIGYVINPYPDPLDLRCWLQSTAGRAEEVLARPVPGRSVRTLDLTSLAAAGGAPDRFDYGTLIVWGSLKPQGYVAIQSPDGRTRAMDHFNPFWS